MNFIWICAESLGLSKKSTTYHIHIHIIVSHPDIRLTVLKSPDDRFDHLKVALSVQSGRTDSCRIEAYDIPQSAKFLA